MKKKLVSLFLVVALVAIAAMGTMAYFTDTDSDKNVMVTGNVYIDQHETDRYGEEFEDQDIFPAVFPNGKPAYDGVATGHNNKAIFGDSVQNVIDKFITVENCGTESIYVRTLIAFEEATIVYADGTTEDASNKLWFYFNDDDLKGGAVEYLVNEEGTAHVTFTGNDGVKYAVGVYTYETPVESGHTTAPSLCQLYLHPTTTNEWSTAVGEQFTIYALSQAVQSEGFNDATVALDAAFGDVTIEKCAEWFANIIA